MKYYQKLLLKKSTVDDFFSIVRKVNHYVLANDVNANRCGHWSLCSIREAEIISYLRHLDENNMSVGDYSDRHEQLAVSINEVFLKIPEFKEWLDKFNLEYYFGKIQIGNWGIHRHVYNTDSQWNLCLLDTGCDGSIVNFYIDPENRVCSDDYIYDHLRPEITLEKDVSININSGDIYFFNPWQWHSFIVPNHKRVDAYILYLKNTKSIEDIQKIVTQLEKYD